MSLYASDLMRFREEKKKGKGKEGKRKKAAPHEFKVCIRTWSARFRPSRLRRCTQTKLQKKGKKKKKKRKEPLILNVCSFTMYWGTNPPIQKTFGAGGKRGGSKSG